MVSPDEAFRSAQNRASKLAQQRRQATRNSHKTPGPSRKRGNISKKSAKNTPQRTKNNSAPLSHSPVSNSQKKSHNDGVQKTRKSVYKGSGEDSYPISSRGKSSFPQGKSPSTRNTHKKKAVDKTSSHKLGSSLSKHRKEDNDKNVGGFFSLFSKDGGKKKGESKKTKAQSDYTDTTQTTFPAVYKDSSNKNKSSLGKKSVSSQSLQKKDKPLSKVKNHSWFSKKDRSQISTDIDDSGYETLSSSNDLNEVKETVGLSEKNTDKVLDAYDDYKVQQQVRSNGKKVEKIPRIYVVIPRKKKFFKVVTSIWAFILTVAIAILCVYGYTVYSDAKMGKEKDAAYSEGVKSSAHNPDVASLMKIDNKQLSDKILAAQGANFPNNAVVDNFSLTGWTYPGGNQKESKAEVDFCYSGEKQKKSQGSVFFYTPDAVSTSPEWTVDTISLTQTPCGGK